jgi:phosphoribosyl-ATP pyrophosphohydrolase
MDTLSRLETTIRDRFASGDVAGSYVAQLKKRGLAVIARKVGEEAIETVTASLVGTDRELTSEAADLLFHLLVLLAAKDVHIADILAELERREGTSGLDEKAGRSS